MLTVAGASTRDRCFFNRLFLLLQAGFLVVAGAGAFVLATGDVGIGQGWPVSSRTVPLSASLIDTSLNDRVTRWAYTEIAIEQITKKNMILKRFIIIYL